MATPTTHEPVVYYVASQFGGIVKIGTSMNVTQRLKRLGKVQPAADLYVMATEPVGEDLERLRHRQFRHSYHQGEWYWLTPDIQAHIDGLVGGS